MDIKTRKRMTIYGMLHFRADVDRFVSSKTIKVEDCVGAEEIGLSNYIQNSEKSLLVAVRN